MRWAVPLLAKPHAVPARHTRCRRTPCLECDAAAHLTEGDWRVVGFYGQVRDQLSNLTPMGKTQHLAPRLEGWVAACELYDVPRRGRSELIDAARYLHESLQDRQRRRLEVFSCPAEDLAPLPPSAVESYVVSADA